MSRDQDLQSEPSFTEQPDGAFHTGHRVTEFRVGDRLPVALSKQQLASLIGVSSGRIDVLRRERSHPAIKELLPRVGHPRFSGATAQAWLDQQIESPVRFLKSARKRSA